jgi:dTDP-4-amino-4,6-dideoxygalactose transaminase
MIPILSLARSYQALKPEIDAAVSRVLASGQYILGEEVARFESEFANYCGARHAVGVGNGLDALVLALKALDIGQGDEVLVPCHTFVATWLAVTLVGAVPVPVAVCPDTYNLDPNALDAAFTPNTRAVIAVHLYGQPADLDPILAFANQRGIRVIEDAAQAHGAKYKARRIGSHSDAVAWSFYPGKNLGALGDGGAVTTSNDEVAASVRRLRNYGSDEKYVHKVCGYNSRLDPIQAAILSVKLSALEEWNRRRERIARLYLEQLDSTQLVLPKVADFAESVWHLFVVRHPRRDALQAALTQHGVQTLIHYPIAPHAQEAYRTLNLHNELADQLASTVLSLPMDPIMPMNEVAQVIEVVNRCVNEV